MEDNANYKPFLKAMSGVDPVQARRFAAAKSLTQNKIHKFIL
jgi:hypothetical protein